jgi:hypothetical protein
MGLSVTATTPDYLPAIDALIHDWWFEAADVDCNETTGTLTIPFTRDFPLDGGSLFRRRKTRQVQGRLIVRGLPGCTIRDTEGVGRYDFNRLSYDSATRKLRIETGVPIHIEASVNSLDVGVELTDFAEPGRPTA